MRSYDDMISDYLDWLEEKTSDSDKPFSKEDFHDCDDKELQVRKGIVWKTILDLSYRKDDGVYWFTKFILGDLMYAGYPNAINFNGLWWKWNKIGKENDHVGIKCARQHGKEQPYSAKIITPNGWTTMGQLKIGDMVFSEKGKETTITTIFEQGKKDVYKITFTDGSTVECGLEHLWKVRSGGIGKNGTPHKWKTKNLKEIIEERGLTPSSDKAYRIPLTKPVQFKKQSHYIDPYTIGALIGDGSLSQDSCIITTGDDELINTIKTNMPQLQLNKTGKYSYRLIDKKIKHKSVLLDELRELKLLGTKSLTKFIPNEYLIDSVENRTNLLRGLMDTDGSIFDTCIMEYYSISEQLSEQVKELVQSLGGKARIDIKNGRYKEEVHKSYRVKIWLQDINPFKLKRKSDKFYNIKYQATRIFKSIELIRKEKSRCIMVDDESHTYLTNNYIVTHNSTYWTVIQPIYRTTMFANYNVLVESASEDQAIMLLGYIMNIIVNNEFLDSKRAKNAKWSTTEISYNNGKVVGKGVGAEVRGGTYDYIVCDDILRSDNKFSDEDIEKFVGEELEAMIFVRKGQMVIVGTPKSESDIFSTIEELIRTSDNSGWTLHTYPAITNWEQKEVLCDDRFTWGQLMKKKDIMGQMKFDKEFMCKTYSSGSQLFPHELRSTAKKLGANYKVYSKAKPEEQSSIRYYVGVDCARAGTASADFTVLTVIAYNTKDNTKRVVWVWRKKGLKIKEQVDQIAEISRNFGHPIILVEKNNMGQDFIDIMVDNYNLNVESFTTGGKGQGKEDLIRYLVTAFENEKIILPTANEFSRDIISELDRELERFVVEVTRAGNEVFKGSGHTHDDMVISLALANRCSQSYGYEPFSYSLSNTKTTPLERFASNNDEREVLRF